MILHSQNDSNGDDIRKRSRFYQGLLDSPVLKSGKETRYKYLPSTVIVFITQDDIFGRDLARYTFREQCEELPDLTLDDGTSKIFLNMASFNGRKELVSLLQYMKNTRLDNPDIIVKDERICKLDKIVGEVRESEEWEDVRMNIMEIAMERGMQYGMEQGLEQGIEQGLEQGKAENLIKNVQSIMKNLSLDLPKACEGLGITVDEYQKAKEKLLMDNNKH